MVLSGDCFCDSHECDHLMSIATLCFNRDVHTLPKSAFMVDEGIVRKTEMGYSSTLSSLCPTLMSARED